MNKVPVNMIVQILLSIIIPLLSIAAFYRINKLRSGIIIVIVAFAISTPLQMILPFPYGLVVASLSLYLLPVYFVIKWSREWNNTIPQES